MGATNAVVGVSSVGYRPLSCVNGVGGIAVEIVSCRDFNAIKLALASDRSRWRSAICLSSLVDPVPGGESVILFVVVLVRSIQRSDQAS